MSSSSLTKTNPPPNLTAALRRGWKAKVAALIIAVAIWYVIKEQEGTPPPAGGGSSMYEESLRLQGDLFANQPTLRVEEPSWYLCGDYVRRIYVFEPASSTRPA